MESLVALLFNVVITISSFLFSSSPCCLFFMDFPSGQNRKFIEIYLYWKVYEITFPTCRMDLPGPTTSVGTRTDYSVGPWDYPTCAARYLMAWSTRATDEKYSVRKLYMSCTVWKTHRRTRLVLSLFRLVTLPPGLYKARQGPISHHLISSHGVQLHHLVIVSNQSRATQHTGRRVLRTSRPEPV
jgi:hypothetical protein